MTDYSAVSPPLSNSSGAYADALQRARQIAAKINTPNGGNNKPLVGGVKRPVEDSPGMDWGDQGLPSKRPAMNEHSNGQADRSCPLPGGQVAIDKTNEMVADMVNRGGSFQDRSSTFELVIPAAKVGLIIGKGGETIRGLQERTGVKMVLLPEGMNSADKTLSIKGDAQKAEYAKQLVVDLLSDRDPGANRGFGGMGRGNANGYGPMSSSSQEFGVPVQAVGVVIGKGGDMIKKIQQDSGARLQFQQDIVHTEDGPGERMCLITGMPEQIQIARSILHELISSVLPNIGHLQQRDQQNVGRGRGRGRGMGGFDDRRPGMGGRGGPLPTQVTYSVPANKCGIVIGKGGETIRNINQQSGAHAHLSQHPPANPEEKVFIIRGMPDQIEHCKQLINEKIGGVGVSSSYGHHPMSYGQSGPQSMSDPNAYQQWQSQGGQSSGDQSKQAADAWAAYYAQYYNQTDQQTGQPAQTHAAPSSQQGAGAPAVSAGGQPDYSAQWIEYYRSMGMYREAEMIEQQAKQQQSGSQTSAAAAAQPAAQAPQVVGQPGSQAAQHHYDQYGQYDHGAAYSYNYGTYPSQPQ